VIETEALFVEREGVLGRAAGMPPHADRYERAGIDLHRLLDAPAQVS
jgi:pilus assembly protein CpaF